MIWHIVAIVLFIFFIVALTIRVLLSIIIKKKSFSYSHNNHVFYNDLLLTVSKNYDKKNKIPKQSTTLYETNFLEQSIISKYAITKLKKDKSLKLEYTVNDKMVNFQIFCYDAKVRLIEVIEVNHFIDSKYSNSICLPKKCEYINLVETSKGIDIEKYKNKTFSKLLLLLDSLIFISLAFVLTFVIIVIFNRARYEEYLVFENVTEIAIILGAALITNFYFLYNISYKRNYRSQL